MIYFQEKRQSTEIDTKITQILNLADKNFKAAVITTLSNVKENILNMNIKTGNITREI